MARPKGLHNPFMDSGMHVYWNTPNEPDKAAILELVQDTFEDTSFGMEIRRKEMEIVNSMIPSQDRRGSVALIHPLHTITRVFAWKAKKGSTSGKGVVTYREIPDKYEDTLQNIVQMKEAMERDAALITGMFRTALTISENPADFNMLIPPYVWENIITFVAPRNNAQFIVTLTDEEIAECKENFKPAMEAIHLIELNNLIKQGA